MDVFILELVSNRLTVPVKIDGRQEQDENIRAIDVYARIGHARDTSTVSSRKQMRSWVAWCLVDVFILELVSNRLTVPVKIDGRQEQDENIRAIDVYARIGHARDTSTVSSRKQMRSWVAWCLVDVFILELVSNRLTVPVKIDGRQEQDENIRAIDVYTRRTCTGYKYSIFEKTNAKLGGVVSCGYIHPRTSIQSVNCTCEN